MADLRIPSYSLLPRLPSLGQSIVAGTPNVLFDLATYLTNYVDEDRRARRRSTDPDGYTRFLNIPQQGTLGELLDWTAVKTVLSQTKDTLTGEVTKWKALIKMASATVDQAIPAYVPDSQKNTGTEESPVVEQMTWREWLAAGRTALIEHDTRGDRVTAAWVVSDGGRGGQPLAATVLKQLEDELPLGKYTIVSEPDYQSRFQP
jgi:hypothetical protein